MGPLLQPGLTRASLHEDRLGQSLEALFAAHLNRVCGAIALHALAVSALSTPWRHQETTTLTRYGAYEEAARPSAGPVPPRPASGHSKAGHDDRKQVRLSLGVSREGLPLRPGLGAGNTSDSTEPPVALAACLARGLDGGRGLVADRKASGQRTLG
jgi:transposase